MKKPLFITVLSIISSASVSACSDSNHESHLASTDTDSIGKLTSSANSNAKSYGSDATSKEVKSEVASTTPNSIDTTSGNASWYGAKFNGRLTASGEIFNMNNMTAAHRTLTFGTKVRITNQDNGNSTIVCVNDRGPYSKNRIIDLSKAAASEVDMISAGTAKVRLEVLHEPTSWKYGKKVCQD